MTIKFFLVVKQGPENEGSYKTKTLFYQYFLNCFTTFFSRHFLQWSQLFQLQLQLQLLLSPFPLKVLFCCFCCYFLRASIYCLDLLQYHAILWFKPDDCRLIAAGLAGWLAVQLEGWLVGWLLQQVFSKTKLGNLLQ